MGWWARVRQHAHSFQTTGLLVKFALASGAPKVRADGPPGADGGIIKGACPGEAELRRPWMRLLFSGLFLRLPTN